MWGLLSLAIYILTASIYLPYTIGTGYFGRNTTIALSCLHTFLLLMVLCSWLRVKFTNAGNLIRPNKLTAAEVRLLEKGDVDFPSGKEQLLAKEFIFCEQNGQPKWCTTCHIYRPTRAAHCSETGRCVANLDHYCPALGCAIGAGNYKYFYNFLGWLFSLVLYLLCIAIVAILKIGPSTLLWILFSLTAVLAVLGIFPVALSHTVFVLRNIGARECRLWGKRPRVPISVHVGEYTATRWDGMLLPGRVTVYLPLKDMRPWAGSWRENWKNRMGAEAWRWFLPVPSNIQRKRWEFEFNETTTNYLRKMARDQIDTRAVERTTESAVEVTKTEMELKGQEADLKAPEKAHVKDEITRTSRTAGGIDRSPRRCGQVNCFK
jgi:hypothetical protein